MSMNTMLTSNSYHSKYIWYISILIQIRNFKKIQSSRVNIQRFSKYFSVRRRTMLILCFVYMLSYAESKAITSYMLLSMNVLSTWNFELEEWFHDIKISMNAYKYSEIMSIIQLNFLNTHCTLYILRNPDLPYSNRMHCVNRELILKDARHNNKTIQSKPTILKT